MEPILLRASELWFRLRIKLERRVDIGKSGMGWGVGQYLIIILMRWVWNGLEHALPFLGFNGQWVVEPWVASSWIG
jgi:hypothetical protein